MDCLGKSRSLVDALCSVIVFLYFQCYFAATDFPRLVFDGRYNQLSDMLSAKSGQYIKVADIDQGPGCEGRKSLKTRRNTDWLIVLKGQKNNGCGMPL